MQRNDDVLEEDHVLVSERNSESTDDTGQNIEELGSTIEFVILVDERKETFIDGLSNHFSSWNKFGIQFMQNVL